MKWGIKQGAAFFRTVWEEMLDSIYPKASICPLCGLEYGGQFCKKCVSQLKGETTVNCRLCDRVIENPCAGGNGKALCERCSCQRPLFSCCVAAGVYEGLLKEAIHFFKYTGKQSLNPLLARLMLERIVTDDRFLPAEVVVPVPLHPDKIQVRSFNQAQLLAQTVAVELGLPLEAASLVRLKNTLTQSKLTAAQRRDNLRGAFGITKGTELKRLKDKRVILVDDIMTTGTTAEECTLVLKEAGVCEVFLAVLATGRTSR